MPSVYMSNITDDDIINLTTLSATTSINNEDMWNNVKTFFNLQNSLIILAIICLIFFMITLCLIFIIIHLVKTKRSYQIPLKTISNNPSTNYPKLDQHLNFSTAPIQMGLTSNQIASFGNIHPIGKDIKNQESTPTIFGSSSFHESNQTQSFDHFENELKRTWNERGITNDDEIETVNEVLEMEERNGKIYYKVNFTGHPSDYTAWVCEEDLIPE
ncbi:hypothetical protein I4U23_013729 [Adineta vaga]|nr:hypothetical protein I4U23_013729 [Adineta vaga]